MSRPPAAMTSAADGSPVAPVAAAVRPLVVAVDALSARFGGGAYAVLQLATALARHDDVGRVIVIAQKDSIVGRGVRRADTAEALLLRAPAQPAELAWRLGWQAMRLPAAIAAQAADVLVSFSGIVPRRPGCPVIAVLANPVPYAGRRGIASRVRRRAIARTLGYAAASYVPSEGMRRLVGEPGLKVVPLGVDHEIFFPRGPGGRELLCVGDFYDHKRHALIMQAWRLLPEPRPRLRMIGNPSVDPQTFASIRAAAAGDERIVVAGHVSLDALTAAYAAARVLVLPSELESFGMPLAEALASGVPAVVRDDSVLRETAGPAGLPVIDDTPRGWAAAIQRLISDDGLHASMRAAGIEHARRYSWNTIAEQIVADARRPGLSVRRARGGAA